nr:extracellular solute-binding protein [Marinobacter sp. SS8-8]
MPEGIIAWLDSFVIPKNSKNPEAAHEFIRFVLQPPGSCSRWTIC